MSTNAEQIDRLNKFLKENSLPANSIFRQCFMLFLDILLVTGMIYLTACVVKD
jgi:hypothetical protein